MRIAEYIIDPFKNKVTIMFCRKAIFCFVLLSISSKLVSAQTHQPLPPTVSMSKMELPEGYEVRLFAAEPAIKNVFDWAWDHKGRLWVTESVDYPHTIVTDSRNGGNDKIKILEDIDGDGEADKVTVFAEGLNMPMGIVLTEKGVIVTVNAAIYLLEDTDGDDQANKTTLMYSVGNKNGPVAAGFNTNDTHTQNNSPRYGLDNQIYVTHGGTDYTTPTVGIFNIYLDGSDATYFHSLNMWNNIWSVTFDPNGSMFSPRADGRIWNTVIPRSHFDKIGSNGISGSGQEAYSRGDYQSGHWFAAERPGPNNGSLGVKVNPNIEVWSSGLQTGLDKRYLSSPIGVGVYTGRLFDNTYHDKVIFMNDPGTRTVIQRTMVPNGSSYDLYKKSESENLITSGDPYSSFIRSEVGPDGAVWVMDLYNTNIGHFEGRDQFTTRLEGNATGMPRDTDHARIYRIVPTAPPETDPSLELDQDDIPKLVQALRHDNMFWRMTAQRLLTYKKSQKQEVVEAILPTLRYANRTGETENYGTVHALWTLHGLGEVANNVDDIIPLLRHPSDAVVMAAVQVLPKTQAVVNAIRDAKLLEDENPHLRVKVLVALSDAENGVSGVLGMRSADQSLDQHAIDGVAMANTKVVIGSVGDGGERLSDLTLETAPSIDYSGTSLVGGSVSKDAAPTLYAQSGVLTGKSFGAEQRGVVSFYSLNGALLGTRTLEGQNFLEGSFQVSSPISFYRLSGKSEAIGKLIRSY